MKNKTFDAGIEQHRARQEQSSLDAAKRREQSADVAIESEVVQTKSKKRTDPIHVEARRQ